MPAAGPGGGRPAGPTVRYALCGTFDVDNFGDLTFPLVATRELRRRHPGAVVDTFSPFGWLHRIRTGGTGPVPRPLGPWTPSGAARLAAAYHCVVVGGGEIIHLNDPLLAAVYEAETEELARLAPSRFFVEGLGPDLERSCPVVWHAVGVPAPPGPAEAARLRAGLASRPYVAVRDRFSRDRLLEAGVAAEVAVVPDSALLVDRVFPAAGLRDDLDRLRREGRYPPGRALVIQGCDLLVPHADRVAAALRCVLAAAGAGADPVIIETGPCRGDGGFAAALEPRLGRRVWRMGPPDRLGDVAAALAGAWAFTGSSLHGAIAAFVYGRPFVLLNLAGESKLDGFADLVGRPGRVVGDAAALPSALEQALADAPADETRDRLQARVDDHFDRIAELAGGSVRTRGELPEGAAAAAELERLAVAGHLGVIRDVLRERGNREESQPADGDLRTWRDTARPRALYHRLRARRRSR